MTKRQPQRPTGDHNMQDAAYLRARAHHLRAAAATSRDPEIARALRQVAGDFDSEARHEAEQDADRDGDARVR